MPPRKNDTIMDQETVETEFETEEEPFLRDEMEELQGGEGDFEAYGL